MFCMLPPGIGLPAVERPAAWAGPAWRRRRAHMPHLVDERAGGVDAILQVLVGRALDVDARIAAREGETRAARTMMKPPPTGVPPHPAGPLTHHPAGVRAHHPRPHPAIGRYALLPARPVPVTVARPLVGPGWVGAFISEPDCGGLPDCVSADCASAGAEPMTAATAVAKRIVETRVKIVMTMLSDLRPNNM